MKEIKCKFVHMQSYDCPNCKERVLHEVAFPAEGTVYNCLKCKKNHLHGEEVIVLPLN